MKEQPPELTALPLATIIDESILPPRGVTTDDPLDQEFPVVEMFYSIQGEGYHSGAAAVFIRFGGCNLACEWCDTNFAEWENLTLRRIIRELAPWDCNRIVLTGGEPALQDLTTLSRVLRPMGYELWLETNGTIEVPKDVVDWICVSPKDQIYPNVKIRQLEGDELKVVWLGQPLEMYEELMKGFSHHYLQPLYDEERGVEWNGRNFRSTVEMVKNNSGWCLSLQTHKWLGVD